jgi:23S rRNA pseudouridine1911/1915/1917 synthase
MGSCPAAPARGQPGDYTRANVSVTTERRAAIVPGLARDPTADATAGPTARVVGGRSEPARSTTGDSAVAHLDDEGNPRIVERRFVVEDAFDGFRLDHYLKQKIPRLSRTRVQEVIRAGVEASDGRTRKPSSTVHAGLGLVLRRAARPEPLCPRDFAVLYKDDEVMVVDKPAGLPVHASAKFYFNTLARVVSERFPAERWQMCHRLDRETSGVLVMAQGRPAAARLKQAFFRKEVDKTYLAIVRGVPAWDEREVDLPLGLAPARGTAVDVRMVVRPDGLAASTRFELVSRHGERALVRCRPRTGRQHQIRAHLAAIGSPILGDKLYAHGDEIFQRYCDDGWSDELLALVGLERHALHAAAIEIAHPSRPERLRVESPLPPELVAALERTTG